MTFRAFCVLCVLQARVTFAQFQVPTTIATFNGSNGYAPQGDLMVDPVGNVYGTTYHGGANGAGTVFRVDALTYNLSTLAAFNGTNGAHVASGVIADNKGLLYGTTEIGGSMGYGTVFAVNPVTQAITTLVSFNHTNGAFPLNRLLPDADGNLYGTTPFGGENGWGTVFEVLASTHELITLKSFSVGQRPISALTTDANGNMIGTTAGGGPQGAGAIFKIDAITHAYSVMAVFDAAVNGDPPSNLVRDTHGNFYGTTMFAGGPANGGTLFEFSPSNNTITTLVTFDGTNGGQPQAGVIVDPSGNLYGTTYTGGDNGVGTVFRFDTNTHTLTTLASFTGSPTAPPAPEGALALDANGHLYGTLYAGGDSGLGTVFEIDVPEPTALPLLSALALLPRTRRARRRPA